MLLLSAALAAALSASDLQRLSEFSPDWAEARPDAAAAARGAFAGRAQDIAERFLRHNEAPPRNDAYFFVLSALGDTESTLTLIHALPDPPKAESGTIDRFAGEITALVGSILEKSDVGADERVASALVEAIGRARRLPGREYLLPEIISLIGRCRGPAANRALERFAADADPALRTAAAQALGGLGGAPPNAPAPAIHDLVRLLRSDANSDTRREAATSLARIGQAGALEPLRDAVDHEEDPRVVDAIVFALERLGAPLTDPAACRRIAEKCWEAEGARMLFERWAASVDRQAILAAATGAAPALRALALRALVGVPENRALVRLPAAAPSPPDPRGAHASAMVAQREEQPMPETPASALDPETSRRLVDSAVDLLGRDVALSTRGIGIEALWELAGRRIPLALEWADRIPERNQRYWASFDLWFRDRAGYDAYRRARELVAAGVLGGLCLLALWLTPAWRREAWLAFVVVLGWGASTFSAEGSLGLPPWPLPLSTVRFLVAFAVAAASAAALRLPRLRWLAAALVAGPIFFVAYAVTREVGFFSPETQSGYVFLFEPAIGLVLAPTLALALTLVASRFEGSSRAPV